MRFQMGTYLASIDVLRKPSLIYAFNQIDRADFVSRDFGEAAYSDIPLPIGFGQTISQPSTVGFMFELLDPRPGNKIMDLGSGSGWTTALLAQCVIPDGLEIGVEIIPELVEIGRSNLAKYPGLPAVIKKANNKLGVPEEAPYDKILVSAAAQEPEKELLNQLKIGGRLVMPIEGSIFVFDKTGEDEFQTQEFPGYVFVPLRKYK